MDRGTTKLDPAQTAHNRALAMSKCDAAGTARLAGGASRPAVSRLLASDGPFKQAKRR